MAPRSAFQRFIAELRRRHVPQTVAVYLVAGWAAIQFADVIVPNLGWPQVVVTAVIVAAAVGLPVVVVLAWLYDLGPGGLHRTDSEAESERGALAGHRPDDRHTSPWLIAVAVLVVGVGSALAVAALIESGGEAGDAAGDATPSSSDASRPGVPPGPPSIVGSEFGDSLLRSLGDIDRALNEAGMDSLVELGRRYGASNLAGSAVEILEPDTWRFGALTPMRPGDTIDVSGIARDTSGVLSVAIGGRVVAESAEPVPALRFETRFVAPEGSGHTTTEVVVRTRSGEVRRELEIMLLPREE